MTVHIDESYMENTLFFAEFANMVGVYIRMEKSSMFTSKTEKYSFQIMYRVYFLLKP